MAFVVFGGVAGIVFGLLLSHLLFGPKKAIARPPLPPVRRDGNPGAGFLLVTLAVFGGMVAGGLLAG